MKKATVAALPKERPARRTRKSTGSKSAAVTRAQLNGGKFSPSVNPPDTTAQPWYPLVLSWVSIPGNVLFKHLLENFKRQFDPLNTGLNPTSKFAIQIRFRKVSVWNLTGKALSLSVYDDLVADNENKDQLGGWTDCGGPAAFPAIGYTYSYAHANKVHRPEKTNEGIIVYNTTASSASDSVLNHLAILWRFDGSVRALSVLPSHEERLLAGISSITAEIKAQQPSTFEKVIDGVKSVASLVTIAAAARSDGQLFADRVVEIDPDLERLVDLVVHRLALRGTASLASLNEDGVSGDSDFSRMADQL